MPEQPASSPSYATGTSAPNDPLTPAQIATEFVQLPLEETQKLLMKILLSEKFRAREKQATTEELDTTFATLPDWKSQKSLYAKWGCVVRMNNASR